VEVEEEESEEDVPEEHESEESLRVYLCSGGSYLSEVLKRVLAPADRPFLSCIEEKNVFELSFSGTRASLKLFS